MNAQQTQLRLLLIIFLLTVPLTLKGQFSLSLESGTAFSGYNDVRVPNGDQAQGTLFSLHDDFDPEPTAFFRVEFSYLIADRHIVELTAAPLQLDYSDAQVGEIDFANTDFSGENIDGSYQFNTYRASYRYRLVNQSKLKFDLGATLLLRDARIALSQNGIQAEDTDLGLVPLLSFHLDYAAGSKWNLLLKGDALVGPQGRAEDIFAGALYRLGDGNWQLKGGYRLIEGGADVEQVYNFALIHFADLGVVYTIGQ
ncbi:hypothetical protein [Algoriphagus namhaensis]